MQNPLQNYSVKICCLCVCNYQNHSLPSMIPWLLIPVPGAHPWTFITSLIYKVNVQPVLACHLPSAPKFHLSSNCCNRRWQNSLLLNWASEPANGTSGAENGTRHMAAGKATCMVRVRALIAPKSTEKHRKRGTRKAESIQEHNAWETDVELGKAVDLSDILSTQSASSHLQANAGTFHGDCIFLKQGFNFSGTIFNLC